jgi:ketosteroid isomerase-like protein
MTEGTRSKAHSNRQTVLQHFEAKIRLDGKMLAAQMAPDVMWWAPRSSARLGMPRPMNGRDAVIEMLTSVPLYQPDTRRWTIHDVVADDDRAVVHASLSAMTRSGVSYENDYAFVFHFRDGLIRAVWEHLDTAYAYERFAEGSDQAV